MFHDNTLRGHLNKENALRLFQRQLLLTVMHNNCQHKEGQREREVKRSKVEVGEGILQQVSHLPADFCTLSKSCGSNGVP